MEALAEVDRQRNPPLVVKSVIDTATFVCQYSQNFKHRYSDLFTHVTRASYWYLYIYNIMAMIRRQTTDKSTQHELIYLCNS